MMPRPSLPLQLVDGTAAGRESTAPRLRPGELVPDREGRLRRLPRYFYEVPSWDAALETSALPTSRCGSSSTWTCARPAAAHLGRATCPARSRCWPRTWRCCAAEVGTYVHVAANGGYRSPAHAL
jgi:hypothetical protein